MVDHTPMMWLRHSLIVIVIYTLTGCSSVVTSTVAFAVATHSEITSKQNVRYHVLSDCILEKGTDAFMLSESILDGAEVTDKQNRIINTLEPDAPLPPFPRYQVAYAFLVISERLEDIRAVKKKKEYLSSYPEDELEDVESIVKHKYYTSYLQKCFSVPEEYQLHIPARDKF